VEKPMKNITRLIRTYGLFMGMSFLTTIVNPLHAQWIQTNGPYSGKVQALAVSGTNLYAGTEFYGVYLSSNDGTTWNVPSRTLLNYIIFTLSVIGTDIFAGTTAGLYCSSNNGTDWTRLNTGQKYIRIFALASSGSKLIAGTDYGIIRSTNNGTDWYAINIGLPLNMLIWTLAVFDTNIYAGVGDSGVYRSTNNGFSWGAAKAGLPTGAWTYDFALSGSNLFVGTSSGVFRSTNNGFSWVAVNNGLLNAEVSSLAVCGMNVFAGTFRYGVFLSTDYGTSWTTTNMGLTNPAIYALSITDTNLIAGTQNGVWRRPLSEMITSVDIHSTDLPIRFNLKQNYPNPFNPSTKIQYTVPQSAHVTLKVYDLLGKEVAILVDDIKERGIYTTIWQGQNFPSGVYFYRLTAGTSTITRKLMLLR
jgi:ligand-binding sensor domain-containing protein